MRDVREIKEEYKDVRFHPSNGKVYFAADLCEIIELQQEALEWYVDAKNYSTRENLKDPWFAISMDQGHRARKALLEDE